MPLAAAFRLVPTLALEPDGIPADGRCIHCRSPIPDTAASARFCCRGCEAVHSLLLEQGLGRYYELAGDQVAPATSSEGARSHTWLEPLLERSEAQGGEVCSLQLDVQGIHCAACVWLMNETYQRHAGPGSIIVNPALGAVSLSWKRGQFDVTRWVREVEAFGYQFGPARKTPSRRSIDLPLRLGISAALTINVMLFSVSFYFGLSLEDPEIFRLFTGLSLLFSTATVFVGGWPFFQAALRGLKGGLLHLDLPIAMGIALVYSMSLVQLLSSKGRGDFAYFDTLNTFITLMLLGRFLQERMLERNRRYLLDDDGAEGLLVRKVVGERLVSLPAPGVGEGDILLVAPGDLVPVDATLLEPRAKVSTDWITGEAAPRQVTVGQSIPAGSFNAGHAAFHVRSTMNFVDSPLVRLLRQPAQRAGRGGTSQRLWAAVAKRWVLTVVGISVAGLLLWLPRGLDQALNVAVALLVVTCPCAIGIAVPLAYELTQSKLRRAGFFVRSLDLLDRLTAVREVLFDKTGTLTLGRLELAAVPDLDQTERDVAYNLAVRSSHPVATAVGRAFEATATYDVGAQVEELPGRGMQWLRADGQWRLGRSDWAANAASGERETMLTRDGVLVARLPTREALRPDAAQEVAGLTGAGYGVWLLSGDTQAHVDVLAATLGIPGPHARGGLKPEDKAAEVQRIGAATALYLGDGVNDALAFEQAVAAGTPAIDRPVMPSRSDFFLVGEGLGALHEALARSLHLRVVVKRVLALSVLYNVVAITASLLGFMSPLAAAVTMPLSTLGLLLVTITQLRRFSRATAASTRRSKPFSALALAGEISR